MFHVYETRYGNICYVRSFTIIADALAFVDRMKNSRPNMWVATTKQVGQYNLPLPNHRKR